MRRAFESKMMKKSFVDIIKRLQKLSESLFVEKKKERNDLVFCCKLSWLTWVVKI